MINPAVYIADEELLDGSIAHLRAIRPDDKVRLRAAFHRLTGRSVYFRFFSGMQELSDQALEYFTEIDHRQHVALVAVESDGEGECIVGVGRYIHKTPTCAEVALAVVDDHQGRGIGTVLLRHLVLIGRMVQQFTVKRLPPDVVAAYSAPFPSSEFEAGPRVFPQLVPTAPGDPESAANRKAWEALRRWRKLFLTSFSDGDPATRGLDRQFQREVPRHEESRS